MGAERGRERPRGRERKIRVDAGEPRGVAAERKTIVKREEYGFNYSLRKDSQSVRTHGFLTV